MAVTNDHRDVECILNVTKSVIYQHVRTSLCPSLLQRIVCHMVFIAGFCNIKFVLVNCVVSTAERPSTINAFYLELGQSTLCRSWWPRDLRRGSAAGTGLLGFGFESSRLHDMSLRNVVCCTRKVVSVTGRFLVQWSPVLCVCVCVCVT
jgi:hypothetical protein